MKIGTNTFGLMIALALSVLAHSQNIAWSENAVEEFDLFAKPTATAVPTASASNTISINSTPVPTQLKESSSAEEDERAIPVTAVGVIFEADGSENSKVTIEKYFRILQKYKFNPGRAFAIVDANGAADTLNNLQEFVNPILNEGIPLNPTLPQDPQLADEFTRQLASANIGTPEYIRRFASALSIIPIPGVPTAYEHVKSFPTWMLYTKNGQILLEGITDPFNMLTANGKFVEPLGVSEVK